MSTAAERASILRRPKDQALQIQMDPFPKMGGRLATIDPDGVAAYQREVQLWIERLIDQIRKEVAEN